MGWGGGRKGEIGGIKKSETQREKDGNWETQRNKERNRAGRRHRKRRDRGRETHRESQRPLKTERQAKRTRDRDGQKGKIKPGNDRGQQQVEKQEGDKVDAIERGTETDRDSETASLRRSP